MDVPVLIFGQLTDITGATRLVIENVSDTDAVRAELLRLYPALADTKFVVALDKKIITENAGLAKDSTLALLPPFSGG